MLRFGFSEAKGFLAACAASGSRLRSCLGACRRGMLDLSAAGMRGRSGTAAVLRFRRVAADADAACLALEALERDFAGVCREAQAVKLQSEAVAASVGAPAAMRADWSGSSVAVEWSAAMSAARSAASLADGGVAGMAATLASLEAALPGGGCASAPCGALRAALGEQGRMLSALAASLDRVASSAAAFEDRYAVASAVVTPQEGGEPTSIFAAFIANFTDELRDPENMGKASADGLLETPEKLVSMHRLQAGNFMLKALEATRKTGLTSIGTHYMKDGYYIFSGYKNGAKVGFGPRIKVENAASNLKAKSYLEAESNTSKAVESVSKAGRWSKVADACRPVGYAMDVVELGTNAVSVYEANPELDEDLREGYVVVDTAIEAGGIAAAVAGSAALGAAFGSVIPGPGTLIGAVAGAAVGAIGGLIGESLYDAAINTDFTGDGKSLKEDVRDVFYEANAARKGDARYERVG